ncbi:sensor domain-containing diguanylate cyclase [Nitrosophilus kaiyonis]|uniref:sensor domain-containing diguanylate cyclase n=1 Tax=Nitrosophilus kaiyonis TaxID=2930200 RepID=UPI00249084E4|nr:sensor domain-containing diguanylate cyclase [Nitrosophilus kaiyonis]
MKSLKEEIFRRTVFITVLMILLFGFFISTIFYRTQTENINNFIKTKNSELEYFIKSYFIKMYNAIEYLSQIREIRNAPFLKEKERQKVLELFKIFEKIDQDINYIYAGYNNGLLLINNYTPPPGFNPVIRPWYKAALKSFPNISQGIPYQEIKTKEWLVSISKALVDDKGKISGVVSIDTSMEKVIKKLNENKNITSLKNIIMKDDGTIIVANNKLYLGENFIKKYNISKNVLKKQGFFTYAENNHKKIGYINKVGKLNWYLITSINEYDIWYPTLLKTFIIIFIISLLSIFIGFFYSGFFSKEILNALHNLQYNLYAIIEGKTNKLKKTNYSYIEFADIAQNIESLTNNALYEKNKELTKLNQILLKMAIKDNLTELYNRNKLFEEIKKEILNFKRYKDPFCLIMFDIDHFKHINDTYGHDIGDKVLKETGKIIKNIIRSTDIAARWGGEEFMILCPHTSLKNGITLAKRLKESFENHDFGIDSKVTISIGIIEYENEKDTMKNILKKVDKKLYQAKKEGRNRYIY